MPKATIIRNTLRLALLASALTIPLAARAQSGIGYITTPNSGSGGIGVASNATALSGSAAIARGGAATAATGPVTAAGGAGGAGGASRSTSRATGGTGGSSASTSYGSTVTLSNSTGAGYSGGYNAAPSIAPAPVFTANPCSGSPISAGVSFGGGSVTGSFGNGFDGACRIEQAERSPVAREYLCLQSPETRLAIKHMAMLGRAEPCYDDMTEVTAARSRADIVAHVQTVSAAPPMPPIAPATASYLADRCAAVADVAMKPGECQ